MSYVVFLEVDDEDVELVRQRFADASIHTGVLDGDALIAACADATVVSCFVHTRFSKEVIAKLPKLKMLSTRSVGFDHIDVAACRECGIIVCNVPDYGSHVIAEHVFALLLSTLRHVLEGEKRTESGHFDYQGLRGIALRGKTIGIVGAGKIGRNVATIAHGFGMKILVVDQCRDLALEQSCGVHYVTLPELLGQSDIITLHIPENPQTHHIVDERAFDAMKSGTILVNTARGALIDSAAMLQALRSGKLAYALLDVLEHEQNFEENKEIIGHPRVVTTPHIAFYADDAMRNMYLDAFQSIKEWLRGRTPGHVVASQTLVCDRPPISKLSR